MRRASGSPRAADPRRLAPHRGPTVRAACCCGTAAPTSSIASISMAVGWSASCPAQRRALIRAAAGPSPAATPAAGRATDPRRRASSIRSTGPRWPGAGIRAARLCGSAVAGQRASIDCQWHVLELTLAALPPEGDGHDAHPHDGDGAEAEALAAVRTPWRPGGSWSRRCSLGRAQPQPAGRERRSRRRDVLVPSGPGRYLQLMIELTGDGTRDADHRKLRASGFPASRCSSICPPSTRSRRSSASSSTASSPSPRRRGPRMEDEVETFERYLDPDSVPAEAMAYLAGWLGLHARGTWTAEQKRRCCGRCPRCRGKWGTAAGLRAWVRVYLAESAGSTIECIESRRARHGREIRGTAAPDAAAARARRSARWRRGTVESVGRAALPGRRVRPRRRG